MELIKNNIIHNFNNKLDNEKEKFLDNIDNKIENQLNILINFLKEIDKNNLDGIYKFETNSIEQNEDALIYYNNNFNLIIDNFNYKNYYNLKNSKKKITQTIKMMCKILNIPYEKKVKLIYRNPNDKTTKGIYQIKI